ncbi:uncharacterized protein LOC130792328 isoform X1 [Actinidia eriantha]|uniref:uncharacterized protein LOC130792328 isoform X1 n=1 Tax=Actinidia eriantha TaxID=165200 RepID=UPI002588E133|nr:uncharacterized protein LOC130792328 isoform X1 [Actinidia eriantha]
MSENPNDSSSTANTTTVKRYAPPNQRNRSLGRRRSGGDRFERMNNRSANDGENNQVPTSRNVPIADHGHALGSNIVNENPQTALIPLQGCCKSEACELLNDRWIAARNACNDPSIDFTEKPVMYSRTGASAWGQFRPPHQLMSRTGNAGPLGSQMDFLTELQRAIRDANASSEP